MVSGATTLKRGGSPAPSPPATSKILRASDVPEPSVAAETPPPYLPWGTSSSLLRSRLLFSAPAFVPATDEASRHAKVRTRARQQYPLSFGSSLTPAPAAPASVGAAAGPPPSDAAAVPPSDPSASSVSDALVPLAGPAGPAPSDAPPALTLTKSGGPSSPALPIPHWHAPWRIRTVLSSHLGWVRSLAVDPTNAMFASGAADRCIKIFDLPAASAGADGALLLTLTGHVGPVRGLAFSPRHPYLFSAGEDKMVKCWDLETNQVVRHYHGHLSGVFALQLHPTLDVLVTGGRDAVARVWDMRSKKQIHVLAGHDATVGSLLAKTTDPMIVTGSYDGTIKMWDLAAGKCRSTLTHHKKSVRALAAAPFQNTFMSGAADACRKWSGRDGDLLQSLTGHRAVVNALAINDDGVAVSCADDGSLSFWDYESGYMYQRTGTVAQPGSLEAENGVYCAAFDLTGTRLITGEADKTIKIWKMDEDASEETHPVDMMGWKKKWMTEARQRY